MLDGIHRVPSEILSALQVHTLGVILVGRLMCTAPALTPLSNT